MQYKVGESEYVHGGTQKDIYTPNDVESCRCLLCGSDRFDKIYQERGALGIVQCAECELIYTNPRPKAAEQNYFGDATIFYSEAEQIFKGKKNHHRDKNYEYEIARIKEFKKTGRLLDIGSNMGFFLRKAASAGYQVEGVEPSPSLAKIAHEEFNLKITNAYFREDDFAAGSFDIITLIDVFEHVTNPIQLLQTIYPVLKDDGILCIKVPNGNYNKFKLSLARLMNREQQHELFNAYEHVGHYTQKTMKKMVEKAGFQLKKTIVPLPVDPPIWANLTGHYFQYPSPFILDWKRILIRKLFYYIGKLENALEMPTKFAPDLFFIIKKR